MWFAVVVVVLVAVVVMVLILKMANDQTIKVLVAWWRQHKW